MERIEKRAWRLSITSELRGDVLLLTLAGRLAAASCGELTGAVMDAIGRGTLEIAIDCSAVDYISSAGLLTVEAVAARLRTAGGTLVLCGLTEPVRRAIQLAGSLGDVPVESTADAAVQRLTQ